MRCASSGVSWPNARKNSGPHTLTLTSSMRRSIASLIAPTILASVLGACSSLTSTTYIKPDMAFRLGGGQSGAFTVRGTNAGDVAVVVYAERAGVRDSIATLLPGAPVNARFPAQATAVFKNTSPTRVATVAIRVTGDIGALGMGYESDAKH